MRVNKPKCRSRGEQPADDAPGRAHYEDDQLREEAHALLKSLPANHPAIVKFNAGVATPMVTRELDLVTDAELLRQVNERLSAWRERFANDNPLRNQHSRLAAPDQ